MKQYLILFFLIAFSSYSLGQMNKILNDPSIVAQEKRMVFESWGDWKPDAKKLFGIPTNVNYIAIWGWAAPERNRRYRNGEDIRPLKVNGGEETLRLATAYLMKENAKKIKVSVDSISKRSLADYAHITHFTVDADPLWLLYYKRMLKPLKNFPDSPKNAQEWGFVKDGYVYDEYVYNGMVKKGEIKYLQEQLDLLKDKYRKARKIDMPRGKRILMYHDILIGWRKFKSKISFLKRKRKNLIEWRDVNEIFDGEIINYMKGSDREIVQQILNKTKSK